jgi:hypothetical protein
MTLFDKQEEELGNLGCGLCHTSRKIQQVIETEPSSPEAASRGVRGIMSSAAIRLSICDQAMMCDVRCTR